METFHWKQYWSKLKGSLKQVHPELSEQDLDYREGNESQLIERLSLKLRKSTAEINEVLFAHLITFTDDPDEPSEPDEESAGMDPETLLEELEKQLQDHPPSSGHRN